MKKCEVVWELPKEDTETQRKQMLWEQWCHTEGDLNSTGNSTQYSMIISIGKESEKEWMCIYV